MIRRTAPICSARFFRGRRSHPGSRLLLLAVFLVMILGLLGCGSAEVPDAVLSVEQALAGEEGRPIRVQGLIVATESEVVLASALLESYPPQAGGAVLPVKGLDLMALVGLSSTAAQPGMALVKWSDYPVVLEGVVDGGALEVKGAPRVVEAVGAELKVRFSLAGEPLVSGDPVWWVFDVGNLTGSQLDLTFSSGQTVEVVLSQDGEEKYRWSDGKAFIEAIRVETLEPGGTVGYVVNDALRVAAGEYDLTATVTATAGSEGMAVELPQVSTTVSVR